MRDGQSIEPAASGREPSARTSGSRTVAGQSPNCTPSWGMREQPDAWPLRFDGGGTLRFGAVADERPSRARHLSPAERTNVHNSSDIRFGSPSQTA